MRSYARSTSNISGLGECRPSGSSPLRWNCRIIRSWTRVLTSLRLALRSAMTRERVGTRRRCLAIGMAIRRDHDAVAAFAARRRIQPSRGPTAPLAAWIRSSRQSRGAATARSGGGTASGCVHAHPRGFKTIIMAHQPAQPSHQSDRDQSRKRRCSRSDRF